MITLTCSPIDFDYTTGECSNPVWVDAPGLLPSLSVGDAFLLGSAVVAVWSLGFGFKLIRKFIFR